MIQAQTEQEQLDKVQEVHKCRECGSEEGFMTSVATDPDDYQLAWQCTNPECGYLDY